MRTIQISDGKSRSDLLQARLQLIRWDELKLVNLGEVDRVLLPITLAIYLLIPSWLLSQQGK